MVDAYFDEVLKFPACKTPCLGHGLDFERSGVTTVRKRSAGTAMALLMDWDAWQQLQESCLYHEPRHRHDRRGPLEGVCLWSIGYWERKRPRGLCLPVHTWTQSLASTQLWLDYGSVSNRSVSKC